MKTRTRFMASLGVHASRLDALLTPERVRNYPLIFVALGIVILSVSTIQRFTEPAAFGVVAPDYLAHWTGGVMLLSGQEGQLYDARSQLNVQMPVTGTASSLSWFVSPPLVAALYAPFAMMDYPASAALWLVLNVVLLLACIWSLRVLAPRIMTSHPGIVALVLGASAPVLELLGGGQDSAVVLAVWLLALRLIRTPHQVLSGAVLGLALLKPQHVVLVPLVLLVSGRTRAFIGFLIVAAMQALLTVWLVGPSGVARWVGAIAGTEFAEQVQQGQAWKMVSLPAFLHVLLPAGLPDAVGASVTAAVLTAAAVALLVRIRRAGRWSHPLERSEQGVVAGADGTAVLIAALATTIVFSPHLVVYDAILLFPVALHLLEHRPTMAVRLALAAAFWTMWLAPALHLLAGPAGWPLSIVQAPWTALPLLVLWRESLAMLSPPMGRRLAVGLPGE